MEPVSENADSDQIKTARVELNLIAPPINKRQSGKLMIVKPEF